MENNKIKDLSAFKCPFCESNHYNKITYLSVLSVVFLVLAMVALAELLFGGWRPGTTEWVKWLLGFGVWVTLAVVLLKSKKRKCKDCKKIFKLK